MKKQQLEPDMEQQTGSKLGKEYVKAVFVLSTSLFNFHAEYIMQNAGQDEAQSGIKIAGRNINNLIYADDTIAGRNINNLIYADDTSFMAESEEELNSPLMKVKEESEKLA